MAINFSIITVTYENSAGLANTYESVKNQCYENYEWIIIDGLSNDGTVEQIGIYERNIKKLKWLSENDNGIYDAMNKGIKLAAGDYVIFLNSGDKFFNNDVLADTEKAIESALSERTYTRPPLFYGDHLMDFPNGFSLFRKARKASYITHSLPTSHQAFFYPLEFLTHNLYDTVYDICCDYYLTCVAYVNGYQLIPIPVTISYFEIGGRSSQQFLKAIKETYKIQRRVLKSSHFNASVSASHRFISYLATKFLNRYNATSK